MRYEKEFRQAHPETSGEKDSAFDMSNYIDWLDAEHEKLRNKSEKSDLLPSVSARFKVNKLKTLDWLNVAITDGDKVVCHLVSDNGEEYCDEMAQKIVDALNVR